MVSKVALADLKTAYSEWNKTKAGNYTQFIDLFTDDFTMGSLSAGAAGMEFSRDHVSRDQARNYFAEMLNDWAMVFFHTRDYIVQGSEVAVICECCWRHRRTGQIVHSPKLDLWQFKSNKAIGFFEFFDTDQAIGACVDCGPVLRTEPEPLYSNQPKLHDGLTETARSNIRILKSFLKRYDASKGANYGEILAMLAKNLDWTSLANGARGMPFTAKRTTAVEVEGYFKELYRDWEMIRFEVEGLISGGPYVVAHGKVEFRNKHTGKRVETPKADVFRFTRNKIVEFMEYYDTAGAIRAATT